jgi:DNA-binding beta-propeller fold protein YncE
MSRKCLAATHILNEYWGVNLTTLRRISTIFALVLFAAASAPAQKSAPASDHHPLVLTATIPMPHVQGRIDHLAFDPKGLLFVSALGNDSVEVIDLGAGIRSSSITGIPRPQGVAYVAEFNKLFVGSDEGKLYVYDAASLHQLTAIDFGDDVDNLRYDPARRQLYVGYGGGDAGAIAVVDAATNQRLMNFKVGAHPESFQLEASGAKIYVNVPDLKKIAVVDRQTGEISAWNIPFESNFPMALDEADHRLFVATRTPARLLVLDTSSGKMIAALPCVQGSDDLFFDAARHRVYVTGGEGYISLFAQKDPDHYQTLPRVASELGARTSGYFGRGRKGFDLFYVAVPARGNNPAEILVYTLQDE